MDSQRQERTFWTTTRTTQLSEASTTPGLTEAGILAAALPFMERYHGSTIVIKHGGHAMTDREAARSFAANCKQLKMMGVHPVIVHGGGPQIDTMLARLGIQSPKRAGRRVTDAATMEVAEMVLGAINKEIAHSITAAGTQSGVRGVGLSGKDANMLIARKLLLDPDFDYGFVGEPSQVDPRLLETLIRDPTIHYVPVIAPIGIGEDGNTYNINADTVAGAVAVALKARRLLLLTDIAGVQDGDGRLIPQLAVSQAQALITSGVATKGMIPKLETAVEAVTGGVEAAVIMDGRNPLSLIIELLTEHGSGTLVCHD